MYTNEGHNTAQIVKYVQEDRDPFSTPRYAVEEVFHSTRANIVNGKYEFTFPNSWYNGNLNNKSIGLRKIQIIKRPMIITWGVHWKETFEDLEEDDQEVTRSLSLIIPGDWTMDRILSEMNYIMQQVYDEITGTLQCYFVNNRAHFNLDIGMNRIIDDLSIVFPDDPDNPNPLTLSQWQNFCSLIFGDYADVNTKYQFDLNDDDDKYYLVGTKDIWDRGTVFFHASFANNSTNNYLCVNNEFFYKPSKIYEYNFNSINFQIWTSTDGLNPVYIPGIEFIMELCLMHNDRRVTV